jgi:hypothetical protein
MDFFLVGFSNPLNTSYPEGLEQIARSLPSKSFPETTNGNIPAPLHQPFPIGRPGLKKLYILNRQAPENSNKGR